MNFGERIYELRSKNGMSQGELADRLDVSRQAVSKWENNSAVPELDKLLKMSEIFFVSLDELVKGDEIKDKDQGLNNTVTDVPVIITQPYPMRKIAALILFGMAFVTAMVFLIFGGLSAVLYSVPFIGCGMICYFSENHPGIKCLWLMYCILYIFFSFATGIFAYDALFAGEWTYATVMTLGVVAVNIFMIAFTSVRLKDDLIKKPEKAKRNLILLWCCVAAAIVINIIVNCLLTGSMSRMAENADSSVVLSDFIYIFNAVYELIDVTLIASSISFSVRYKKMKKS